MREEIRGLVSGIGRSWHTLFEISGIAFLALLVGAEILAFQYGHRKDELTAIAESNAETKRKAGIDAAEARHKADVEAVQKQLADANKKVSELDRLRQPRHFTVEQKAKLIAFVKANPKTTTNFVIKASAAADDARAYADEIAAAFNMPEIGGHVRVDNAIIAGPDAFGIWLVVKNGDVFTGPVLQTLHTALSAVDVPVKTEVMLNSDLPDDELIWLNIGTKR